MMASTGFQIILAGTLFSAGVIAGVYATKDSYINIINQQSTALHNFSQQTFKISDIYQSMISYCQQQLEMAEIDCRKELEKNDARVCNGARISFVGKKDPLADHLIWRSYEGPYLEGFCQLIINNDSKDFCQK